MLSRIARQPIFDLKMKTVAYELLFREGVAEHFPVKCSEKATLSVLRDLFLQEKTVMDPISNGKPCFVNFSYQSLIGGIALGYPRNNLVVEVLENCTPDKYLFEALSDLKQEGYRIAFDDFCPSSEWIPFLPLADIIKIDFQALPLHVVTEFVHNYWRKFGFTLLAEKIETAEEYAAARSLGFELFQGYYLGRPERLVSHEVEVA